MICVHCSTPVPDEAKFCHSCGSMVSDAGGQAAATAAMDKSAFAHMEGILRDETRGEYTVGKMLGRGGMAVVYLAEETRLGRKVALKVLPPELTFGHGVDRFLREAKTAATLDHPNIIPIYRIASGGKLFWYAMKYLEGRSLEDVLRERGAYSVEETLEVLDQVADALDYAHEHQVIHRDIKPANVMLDGRNRVIITDFGIAKALSEGALTASGSVIGTPYFMSPEQGMGKPVTGAADQYSVAVMAFRMLAGHIPFDGDSAIDILHKHCMMPAPRLEESAPHVPKHICDAIDKALSKKAADRFPNIRSFVKAMKDANAKFPRASASTLMLSSEDIAKINSGPQPKVTPKTVAAAADKTVVAGAAVKPAAAPRPSQPVAKPASKMPMIAAAALVLVGGGGFAAWKMTQQPETPQQQVAENPPANPGGSANTPSTTTPPTTAADPTPTKSEPAPTPTKSEAPRQPTSSRPQQQTPPSQQKSTPPQQQVASNPVTPPTTTAPPPSAPAPAPSAPAATTGVLLLSLSAPAVVSIDGVDKGERGRFREELSVGRHLITATTRDGSASAQQAIQVRGGDTLRVNLTLQPKP